MPVTLSDLQQDERELDVAIGENTLHIAYRPSGITPVLEEKLRETREDERGGKMLVEMLAAILTGWDLLPEPDAAPLPIDEKTLQTLPTRFLVSLVEAITEDSNADPTKSKASAAGSPRKARSASRRSGTSSSARRAT